MSIAFPYHIRPFRESDTLYVWKLFEICPGHGISWEGWTLCQRVPSFHQWVAVNEKDHPVSYIAVSEQPWGRLVVGHVAARNYENQGLASRFWHEIISKMRNRNIGITSTSDVIAKYRLNPRYASSTEIIRFKGRITFLDTLKSLPMGLFNPKYKVYQIQDDRTIEKVAAYDRRCFSRSETDKTREEFLWSWLRKGRVTRWDPAPRIMSLYAETPSGHVVGYGSISPVNGATKIAPLYADNEEIARTLMTELLKYYNSTVAPIDQLILNVPSSKNDFVAFLVNNGMVVSTILEQAFTRYIPIVDYDRVYSIANQLCQLY